MSHFYSIVDGSPNADLYQIERQAHAIPWSESVFMQSIGPGYRWRQLIANQQPQGFSICQQIADELTLHNIAVTPSAQGSGYGKRLLEDVLNYARQQSLMVFLEVRQSNAVAIGLYQSLNFAVVGRRPNYYPGENQREDALVMRWAATAPNE